jgi:phosphate transport system protein
LLRIGRYVKVIANIVKEIPDKPHIADLVIDMLDDAVAAYESDNIRHIDEFSSGSDTIDVVRHSIFREGITYMMEDPRNIPRCTHYVIVVRYLERCAVMPVRSPRMSRIWKQASGWRSTEHRVQQ